MDAPAPIQFPRTVAFNDHRICLRPVTPDDRDRILAGLQEISVETSYRRFFTPTFYPSERELQYLTQIDGDTHMAVGALDCTRDGWPGLGVARYVQLPDEPTVAEGAVLVIDAYQRQGIGSLLLAALSQYAAGHGIEYFRGFVLTENRDFLDFLDALGACREQTHDAVRQLDVPVYPRGAPLPDHPALDRARWAWEAVAEAPIADCSGPVDASPSHNGA
jgi:GNAT superfamily N-acetyltransferase